MDAGTIAALHLHPVKSCRRVEVSEAVVSAAGLAGDREWQVVDLDGGALTQRQCPALATVSPAVVDGGLELSAPGRGSIAVARPTSDDRSVRALLGDTVAVGDAGDAAARWFEAVLGRPCRLVALTTPEARRLPLLDGLAVTFADLAPVLVANEASLADLQARASETFAMDRFRPNLILRGAAAWAEDSWRMLRTGAAELTAIAPWPRCAVPQVDQDTGRRHREPALALRAHRWCEAAPTLAEGLQPFFAGTALFGLGCTIGPAGSVLRVGDAVVVEAVAEPLIDAPTPRA